MLRLVKAPTMPQDARSSPDAQPAVPVLEALQNAQEALHAAVLCYGAARGTNYTTQAGRRHVAAARRRLDRAEEAYYTILMAIREGRSTR